jgi:hypothetical protein
MENNVHQELAELSPLLQELRQKPEGYQVPEGYFAAMQHDVLAQIKAENALAPSPVIAKKENKLANWWNSIIVEIEWLIQPRYAVAFASFILVLTAGFFFLKPSNTMDTAYVEPSIEEIDQYLEENIEDIDTEELTAVVAIAEQTMGKANTPNVPSSDNQKLKDAKPEELDEMMDEMIQNGEISEDDLEEIL